MNDDFHFCPNGEKIRKYPKVVCSMCPPGEVPQHTSEKDQQEFLAALDAEMEQMTEDMIRVRMMLLFPWFSWTYEDGTTELLFIPESSRRKLAASPYRKITFQAHCRYDFQGPVRYYHPDDEDREFAAHTWEEWGRYLAPCDGLVFEEMHNSMPQDYGEWMERVVEKLKKLRRTQRRYLGGTPVYSSKELEQMECPLPPEPDWEGAD
jgi:hypothetical protein